MRGKGKFTHSLAHPGARFFFLFCARRGKFTHSPARPRLCVVFFCCLRGGGNSLTHSRVRGRFFLCLLCARRWTFTHSLARPGVIHSLTGASGGAFFFCSVRGGGNSLTHWRVRGCVWLEQRARFFFASARRGKFTPSLARLRLCVVEKAGAFFFLLRARQGEIHSLTGASGGAFFFLFCARRGKFTHSLARPRLCVVGTEGAFFFCSVRGGGNSLPHWRVCGCVWLKKRARFFFCSVRGKGKFTHSLAHPGARFFFCSVRGGGNSLTHWRVHGCVWFFFVVCAAGKFSHSLARPGALFFLFAVCAAVDIYSLTDASGGDSLTHWRVRGRVFFFLLRARRGKFTHSLARPRLCVVGTEGAFFFLLRARRAKQKKNTGRVFFLFGTRRAEQKKNFFLERAQQKKTHLYHSVG